MQKVLLFVLFFVAVGLMIGIQNTFGEHNIYRDPDNLFSIESPSDWTLTKPGRIPNIDIENGDSIVKILVKRELGKETDERILYLMRDTAKVVGSCSGGDNIISSGPITINGKKGLQTIYEAPPCYKDGALIRWDTKIKDGKDGWWILAESRPDSDDHDKIKNIINSFKFGDVSSVIKEAKIVPTKTYVNNIYDFSILPPNGWSVNENMKLKGEGAAIVGFISNINRERPLDSYFMVLYFDKRLPGEFGPAHMSENDDGGKEKLLNSFIETFIGKSQNSQTKVLHKSLEPYYDGWLVRIGYVEIAESYDEYLPVNSEYALFITPEGMFNVIYHSDSKFYEQTIDDFERSIDSFYIGPVKKDSPPVEKKVVKVVPKQVSSKPKLYSNDQFTIEYPSEWYELILNRFYPQGKNPIFVFRPNFAFDNLGEFAPNIIITFDNNTLKNYNTTDEGFLEDIIRNERETCRAIENCSDFTLIESSIKSLNGMKTFQFSYINKIQAFLTVIPNESDIWWVITKVHPSMIDKFNDSLTNSVETFTLKNYVGMINQGEDKVPGWIKNNAKWWADGTIGDNDFTSGIQFLIKEDIILIPETTASSFTGDSEGIPTWIKNNAGWWADGQISEKDFLNGIEYLVKVGIIRV